LLMENIKPVYVYDGKAHELKIQELERRGRLKKQATESYKLAIEEGRFEDARKYGKRTSVLTDKMVEESKILLSHLGIPVVQAPSDGEGAAAYLTRHNLAFASASQDYDSILFGARRLVRNLAISGRRKIPNRNAYVDVEPEMFEHEKVLLEVGVTHEQLVDVGILVGTDFNPGGFPGIGPKTALKLIKENGRLEKVDKIKNLLPEVPYEEIRKIFLSPEVPNVDEIVFSEVKREKVLDFLCVEKSFSADRVSGQLDKLQKSTENRSQSLEQWFS
jgi:flap endonuclease-1